MRKAILGVFPPALLAVLIGATIAFGLFPGSISTPPNLLFVVNLIFISGTNIAVALLSARSYLKERSSNVLALGCSLLISGLAALTAGLASNISANANVTIFNIGILAASALQVLAALLTLSRNPSLNIRSKTAILVVSYSAIAAFLFLISVGAINGLLPIFFTSSGPTLLRQGVLGLAALLFALAFFVYFRVYLNSKSGVLLAYLLGLVSVSVGLFGSLFVTQFTGVLAWVTRVGQYVGGLYFLVAVIYLGSVKDTGATFSGAWTETFRNDQQQLETLFSKMLNGFAYHRIIVDDSSKPVDYVILAANDSFEKMTGLKREEVVGRRVSEVLPGIENDPADWIGVYGKVALTGQPITFENYSNHLGKWYSVSAYCPRKGYFVALFEDVTERKKAEESLKALNEELEERVQQRTVQVTTERQRLYNVLETLPAYVILLDKDHRVPFANKVFRERFGESLGRRCHEYLFNRDEECSDCITYNVFREDKPQHWYWTGPDGRDYDIYDFPFKEADGSTLILEMGIDITEQKRMEKQLKDSERLAAIGATAGMVGHDLRNPLQSITGDIYLAKGDLAELPDSPEKASIKESLDEIENSINYVNKIVSDLQDYARPLTPVLKETDVKALIHELLEKNGVPKNIKVSSRVSEEVSTLFVDPDCLRRIVGNLVSNAVQAMPNGGKLTVRANQEIGDAVFTVEDTGVGIPDNVQSKLFTPLFTTKSRGQGFGLSVVKRMAEAMGGTVSFESEVGKGTKFIVHLPCPPKN